MNKNKLTLGYRTREQRVMTSAVCSHFVPVVFKIKYFQNKYGDSVSGFSWITERNEAEVCCLQIFETV
jgi:hypothetical protein